MTEASDDDDTDVSDESSVDDSIVDSFSLKIETQKQFYQYKSSKH